MTQELSPNATPEAQEGPALQPGFLPWLRRRIAALQPRTRRHWALYAGLALPALFLLFVWSTATTYSVTVLVTEEQNVFGLAPYFEDRLDFGDLPQGGGATMEVTLENRGRVPARFFVISTGDIRQFIQISDAFFLVDPSDTKVVEFRAGIPRTAAPQRYDGKLYVFKIPWSPWP